MIDELSFNFELTNNFVAWPKTSGLSMITGLLKTTAMGVIHQEQPPRS
jgi:hypothetical protein